MLINKNLAPIAIFVYDRLEETQLMFESLKKCDLFKNSEVFIFSDGPKNEENFSNVQKVREYMEKNQKENENINLIFSEKNNGLANSIIKGVTSIIEKYKKIIVIEDDLILSKDFLQYMNEALFLFEERDDIWSVSGFSPKINISCSYKKDIYLGIRGSSWGWGTWYKKWKNIDWELKNYNLLKDKNKIKEFNLAGNDMYKMLELQKLKKIDSWAIRWCFSQYLDKSYTIHPIKTKVISIGFGNNATHGGLLYKKYIDTLSEKKIVFDKEISKNILILKKLKKYYDINIFTKIGYFLRKHDLFYFQIKKFLKKFIVFKY